VTLHEKYPPSEPCSCKVCVNYCQRPGWWTVDEVKEVIDAGYANRMMLEIAPERNFGVLSPAFKGCEGYYALQLYSNNGCTFLKNNLCELYGTGLQPLECRFCHHNRKGLGLQCHSDIENDWKTNSAKRLIIKWGNTVGFWQRQYLVVVEKLSK
jgi:hypothetical protein